MTGKQRFEAVVNNRVPDKFPLYIPTVSCSVASEILGHIALTGADRLHFEEELSLFRGPSAHAEFEEKLISDTEELMRALRVDIVRETWRSQEIPTKQLDEYTLLFGDENGAHKIKRYFPEQDSYGVLFSNIHQDADELAEHLRAALETPVVLPTMEDSLRAVQSARRLFDRLEDCALGEIISGGSFGISMFDPAWLELSVLEPELLHAHFMRVSADAVVRMRHMAAAGYYWFNGGLDMASSSGPIYSPATFRGVLLEPLKMFASACAECGAVFCYRTDGNIWLMFEEMFTHAGIQAYGEVDRDAGMRVEDIRRTNGNLIILGNTSSALLHGGSAQQVREDMRQQLEGALGTRFIPGPSNAIVHGTPPENVFAMVEEIERFVP